MDGRGLNDGGGIGLRYFLFMHHGDMEDTECFSPSAKVI